MFRASRTGHTPFAGAAVALLALIASLLPLAPASADPFSATRDQIAKLSQTLAQEASQSEITANQYDAELEALANLNRAVSNLTAQVAKKRNQIMATTGRLAHSELLSYILGASVAQLEALFNKPLSRSDARKLYENIVIGNLGLLRLNFQKQKLALDALLQHEATLRAQVAAKTATVHRLLLNNLANEARTRKLLRAITTKYHRQIINYEIAQGILAAKRHDLAGQTRAIAAASAVGGQAAANLVTLAIQKALHSIVIAEVQGTAQGLAAVAAAKSQIGVWYQWGGEKPGVGFDCSGLVQWAWARAGVHIPRTTSTQWPRMTHVPLNQLQPGDLLFYYNLDGDHTVDHVVMYVGSGPYGVNTIIAAARTGTQIALAPLFTTGLIGAARP
jgi:cell wall-associated NlpC family hydrolase